MENEIIQKHNFEQAKDRIFSVSQNVPNTVILEKFPIDGEIFSCNNHNITGIEANRLLVTPLQQTLIAQNNGIKDLFKIAKDVYNALDSVDTEYIAGIVGAVEAAKLASNQAKTASSQAKQASEQALDASIKALDASEKAKVAQADIKRTIEALQKTVSILKDFKADVTIKLNTLTAIPTKIVNLDSKVKSVEQGYNSVIQVTKGLKSASVTLNSISHLKDIDSIWNDVEGHKNDIARIQEQLNSFISEVRITTNEIKESINKQDEINTNAHLKYEKRIKTACCIGGCAVGLSLINYLLQILGIL